MNFDETTSQLGGELVEAIESVKSALSLTATQKNMFHEKAVVAKNQIQDDISFHLELLRNREVWLLDQVDVHAQMKEEAFESRLNELCALLAKLEVCKELLEAQELQASQAIVEKAKEIMSGLSNMTHPFDDVAEICFSADNYALSDAVKNYGNILGESCETFQKKSPDVFRKSASSKESAFIQEQFKRVANSPLSEWLINGLEVKESKKDFGIVWKYFEELSESDSEEWLYNKPQPMDLETVSNRFEEHFQRIKSAPANEWLQPGTALDEDDNSSEYRSYTTLDTSENIKAWLLRPSGGLSSKSEDLSDEGISLCRHSSIDEVSENSQAKAIADQRPDDWLIQSSTSYSAQVPQTTKTWLQRFQESSGTSTSDWLIESESETESYPECYDWLTQDSIDRCKDCPADCYRDTFKVFKNVLNSSKSEWLATVSDW